MSTEKPIQLLHLVARKVIRNANIIQKAWFRYKKQKEITDASKTEREIMKEQIYQEDVESEDAEGSETNTIIRKRIQEKRKGRPGKKTKLDTTLNNSKTH